LLANPLHSPLVIRHPPLHCSTPSLFSPPAIPGARSKLKLPRVAPHNLRTSSAPLPVRELCSSQFGWRYIELALFDGMSVQRMCSIRITFPLTVVFPLRTFVPPYPFRDRWISPPLDRGTVAVETLSMPLLKPVGFFRDVLRQSMGHRIRPPAVPPASPSGVLLFFVTLYCPPPGCCEISPYSSHSLLISIPPLFFDPNVPVT